MARPTTLWPLASGLWTGFWHWHALLAACILPALAGDAASQSAYISPRSTLHGVYTAEQAARGKDVYAGMCKACHSPASHTGATFANWWHGHQLSELYSYVVSRMPKNDPGSLSEQDYADVVAYLLRMNAMPVGKRELPADSVALDRIRIDSFRKVPAPKKRPDR